MKLSILLHTWRFCGDHEDAATVAVEPRPGETVEQLADRLLGRRDTKVGALNDRIEIRVVDER